MVNKLLKIVKEKLGIIGKTQKPAPEQKQNGTTWEDRKAELMESARNKSNRKPVRKDGRPHRDNSKNSSSQKEHKPAQKRPYTQKKSEPQKPPYAQKKSEPQQPQHKPAPQNEDQNKPKRKRPPRRRGAKKTVRPENVQADTAAEKPQAQPAEQKKPEHDWDISKFQVPELEGKLRFHDLKLPVELMHAIADLGFQYCTPIQQEILQATLSGKDATGRAQTGTGKTAAFLITIITKYLQKPPQGSRRPGAPRALILAPTRELVIQIADDAKKLLKYTNINVVEIYGGMDYNKQQRRLRSHPVDIMVATPGRLLDFQGKRDVFLKTVDVLVIDEADRMLDMGFIPDVKKIVLSTPPKARRQTLFFSATLSSDVLRLASQWTNEAVSVEIEPEQVAVDTVKQIVYIVTTEEKFRLLFNLINQEHLERVIVFANRRDETRTLEEKLRQKQVSCEVLSGDVDQKKRIRTLNDFKAGKIKVLVATDVAGRGIHIEGVSHVVNYTLPEDPEDYVHRIGRTGRAGATGISISFASEDDSFQIPAIEKFIGNKLECVYPDEKLLKMPD